MFIGKYTGYFETAFSPWTTLGPLCIVISVSLAVEGYSDIKRHRSDEYTNNAECIILRRTDDIDRDEDAERDTTIIGGKDVIVNLSKNYLMKSSSLTLLSPEDAPSIKSNPHIVQVAFQKIKRMNIRQGHIILIRNREAVPADTIILATSGENGCAYIETSSIDGETNLKLRNSPTMPSIISKNLNKEVASNMLVEKDDNKEDSIFQSLEKATKKITRFSALAYPNGVSTVKGDADKGASKRNLIGRKSRASKSSDSYEEDQHADTRYIATLTSEPPNSHVNTFSGKLTLPPFEKGGDCIELALDAEHILLRGAFLRNTEWVIGFSCYTGKDTKLAQNSFQTPSKFSRIDVLINKCVLLIIAFMCICIGYLSVRALYVTEESFDELW